MKFAFLNFAYTIIKDVLAIKYAKSKNLFMLKVAKSKNV